MNINYLQEYISLVENLNFTATANKLFITQPTLSRHLAYIEEELGVQLLSRTKHNVELTAIGKIVLEDFKKIVAQYDEIVTKTAMMTAGFDGELRIGMLYYAIDEYVTPITKLFKNRFPKVKLTYSSCQPHQLIDYLHNDKVDVGFIMDIPYNNPESIRFYDIYREKLVAMVSIGHSYAARKSINISELKNDTFVFGELHVDFNNYLQHLLKASGISSVRFVYTDQVDTIPFAVEETNGVSIVPQHMKNMRREDMVLINIENDDYFIDMALAYKISNNNPAIQLFLKQAELTLNSIREKWSSND